MSAFTTRLRATAAAWGLSDDAAAGVPPLLASAECPASSTEALAVALGVPSSALLVRERASACDARRADGARSDRQCAAVILAEWLTLSTDASALLLSSGSHFSALVAATALPPPYQARLFRLGAACNAILAPSRKDKQRDCRLDPQFNRMAGTNGDQRNPYIQTRKYQNNTNICVYYTYHTYLE